MRIIEKALRVGGPWVTREKRALMPEIYLFAANQYQPTFPFVGKVSIRRMRREKETIIAVDINTGNKACQWWINSREPGTPTPALSTVRRRRKRSRSFNDLTPPPHRLLDVLPTTFL